MVRRVRLRQYLRARVWAVPTNPPVLGGNAFWGLPPKPYKPETVPLNLGWKAVPQACNPMALTMIPKRYLLQLQPAVYQEVQKEAYKASKFFLWLQVS